MKQYILYITLLGLVPFVMSGCGPTKTPLSGVPDNGIDQSSRVSPTKNNSTESKPAAFCNEATNSWMTADLMVFQDASGYFRNEFVKLKFKSLSSSFPVSSGSIFLRFFRWKASTSGETYLDSTPLKFRVASISGGMSLTGYIDALRWSDLKEYAKDKGIALNNINDFMNYFYLVIDLKDPLGDYDALKVAAYQVVGSGAQIIANSEINGLIPAFYANPTDYATDQDGQPRPAVLQDLHPFNNADSSWTNTHFLTELQGYCF